MLITPPAIVTQFEKRLECRAIMPRERSGYRKWVRFRTRLQCATEGSAFPHTMATEKLISAIISHATRAGGSRRGFR